MPNPFRAWLGLLLCGVALVVACGGSSDADEPEATLAPYATVAPRATLVPTPTPDPTGPLRLYVTGLLWQSYGSGPPSFDKLVTSFPATFPSGVDVTTDASKLLLYVKLNRIEPKASFEYVLKNNGEFVRLGTHPNLSPVVGWYFVDFIEPKKGLMELTVKVIGSDETKGISFTVK